MSALLSAVIVAQRNKFIRTFRNAGATSPGSSIRLSDYSLRRSVIFNRLVRQGIFVAAGEDAFYLDEARELENRKRRLPVLIVLLTLVLAAFIFSYLKSR